MDFGDNIRLSDQQFPHYNDYIVNKYSEDRRTQRGYKDSILRVKT